MKAVDFQQLLDPISHLLRIKLEQECQAAVAAQVLQDHLETYEEEAQPEAQEAWKKETDRLHGIVELKQKPISWIDKGHLQQAFILTCDYNDRVFGTHKCEMCYYYVCLHTQGHSRAAVRAALAETPPRILEEGHLPLGCNTCMPSKIWRRKNEDPAQTRQRWYCKACEGSYKVKFGTIIEMRLLGQLFVAKATIPLESWKDVKASVIEAKARAEGRTFDNTQELFESLPSLRPLAAGTSFMRPAKTGELFEGANWGTQATAEDLKDCYKFTHAAYEALPTLEWTTILAIYAGAGETERLLNYMHGLHEVDDAHCPLNTS